MESEPQRPARRTVTPVAVERRDDPCRLSSLNSDLGNFNLKSLKFMLSLATHRQSSSSAFPGVPLISRFRHVRRLYLLGLLLSV